MYASWMLIIVAYPIISLGVYDYQKKVYDQHSVHVVTISPKEYQIKIVKSKDSVLGLETLSEMATRVSADIAINAGFFEMYGQNQGMPTGTLIIDGHLYMARRQLHQALMMQGQQVNIQQVSAKINVQQGRKTIPIHLINRFPQGKAWVLYSDRWGKYTLTDKQLRKEVQFDEKGELIQVYEHGNVSIPIKGYVLSLPKDYSGELTSMMLEFVGDIFKKNSSAVMGIPKLVQQGKLIKSLLSKKSNFFVLPHARTAIGIKRNGDWVVVVVM